MADKNWHLWVWKPSARNWWIAVLFMIGAALFALGCVFFLSNFQDKSVLDTVFFVGSIFFTSAAFTQFRRAIIARAGKVVYWSGLSQLIGTLMFNMNTFDAFFDLSWVERDLLIWTPNILGSILFQISGSLAMFAICKRWWSWQFYSITWWIGFVNLIGCAAFFVSAMLAFSLVIPIPPAMVVWSTSFTLLGALCFFIGAFLMWPEMSQNSAA